MADTPPGDRNANREWVDPRAILRRHGLTPQRGYSQNFLTNRSAVERIAERCTDGGGRFVVELGPGVGTLTAALLRHSRAVTAIEKDPTLVEVLREEFANCGDRLDVIQGDATKHDFSTMCSSDHGATVCGNLPYAVTGAVFRNLLRTGALFDQAVFMVQKEVHARLLARPGTKEYGALTVFVRGTFKPSSLLILGPGSFHPAPKVSSGVVCLERLPTPRNTSRAFEPVVRAAFAQRRKTLLNALGAAYGRSVAEAALSRCGIDPQRRGETLSVDEFNGLARATEATADARDSS